MSKGIKQNHSFVTSLLDEIRPQIFALALREQADPDDLLQDIAMKLLTKTEKIATSRHPGSYCVAIARSLILMARSQDHQRSIVPAMSLNALVSNDPDVTWEDLIYPLINVSDDQCDIAKADRIIEIIHAALRRLPLEEQTILCELHNITAYTPSGQTKRSCDLRLRSERNLARINALRHLRKNMELKNAVTEIFA